MASEWPGFALIEVGPWSLRWEGVLKPYITAYTAQFDYSIPPPPLAHSRFSPKPRVRVIDPELERHPDYHLGPIPHVFFQGLVGTQPELCVYDPAALEWSGDDLLAKTFVYWTLRWLVTYEGWLATKRWYGKGRSHERPKARYAKTTGAPLRWDDRWASTASELAFRAAVPHPVDRRGWHKRDLPCFRFERFRD